MDALKNPAPPAGDKGHPGQFFCDKCGGALARGARFCQYCGTPARGVKPTPKPGTAPRRVPWKAVVLAVVILAAAGGAILLIPGGDKLQAPVEAMLGALRAGDVDGAYALTAPGFRETTSKVQFERFVRYHPALRKNREFSLTARRTEGDKGYVKGMLVGEMGLTLPVEITLVRESGAWKILGLKTEDMSRHRR